MMVKYAVCLLLTLVLTGISYAQLSPTPEQWQAILELSDIVAKLNASGTANTEDYQRITIQLLNNPYLGGLITQHGLADAQDIKGASLLTVAANNGNLELVETILSRGGYINLQDENGWTALNGASKNNQTHVALYLLGKGADPNIVNTDHGEGPLMWAIENDSFDLVKALIDAGADVNHVAHDGDTPTILAAARGRLLMLELIISKGVDINHQNDDGWSALLSASYFNHVDSVKVLIKAGANPDLQTRDHGETGLTWAVDLGHNKVVRELLVGGANFELPNKSGQTPLMTAARANRPDEVRLLLSAGADINRIDQSGDTPLMDAVNKNFPAVVRVILEHCPDLSIENRNRKTVHFIAFNRLNQEVRDMLNAHPNLQCVHETEIYNVGDTRYDVCREVKCCQGIWSPTGQTLETCGDKCRKVLAPSGVCTVISNCPILVQEFLANVKTPQNREKGHEFIKSYGCGYKGGEDFRVCCPTA